MKRSVISCALSMLAAAGLAAQLVVPARAATWEEVVAAAKKEGSVIVSGPAGKAWHDALMKFQDDYPGIKLELSNAAGRDYWSRVAKEREVKRYLWDVRVGGADTSIYDFMKQGALAPVRDQLMLPEITDENNWYGGFEHSYLDDGKKFFPTFCMYDTAFGFYNRTFIKDEEMPNLESLVDPKWKGKIAMTDPAEGNSSVTTVMLYRRYGEDFMRKLYRDQAPVIIRNPRQMVGAFADGTYPIAIGMASSTVVDFEDRGVKLNLGQVKGLPRWSPGVCSLQILQPRPHPNATTVFINWLLTQKTQEAIMPLIKLNSRRKGVTLGDPERALDMSQLDQYQSGQEEEYVADMEKAKSFVKSIMK
ncbi:MAG TPA: extracellular solute-binding protein [Alphaproteobacteria bacterium]|jgi:iron(III) transport system substrate-binding protein